MRRVVWFSCGAASAVLSKLVLDTYGHQNVHIVYCDVLSNEHPDNTRFLSDIERLLDHKIELIRSEKFSSIEEVFETTKYMSGIAGARCTLEMKRIPRADYQQYGDIHYFGLLTEEDRRIKRFEANNPSLQLEWLLRDRHIKREDCYNLLTEWKIKLPIMYSLGFNNNNCIGCVKAAGVAYWSLIYKHFPDIFKRRAEQSRKLGVRLLKIKGERRFLDELVPSFSEKDNEEIECGPICLREYEHNG